MLQVQGIIKRVEKHKKEIRHFGVKRLAIFGSYARGEVSRSSDVDFLVKFSSNRGSYDDYVGLLELLQHLLGKPVDLVKEELVREELRESILGGVRVEAQI